MTDDQAREQVARIMVRHGLPRPTPPPPLTVQLHIIARPHEGDLLLVTHPHVPAPELRDLIEAVVHLMATGLVKYQ